MVVEKERSAGKPDRTVQPLGFRVGEAFSKRSGWGLSTRLVLGHWLLY
jgi:hypothetical protein